MYEVRIVVASQTWPGRVSLRPTLLEAMSIGRRPIRSFDDLVKIDVKRPYDAPFL
ncbi:hypothetical protein RB2083_2907 [Rhodobacteraceae bacterium HTCC2083]|nr:hypothetical protein RB2083_2907 [Rhodobacteraceae bacterium HTCC2083]